ncbi:MAG: M15 family metallopeptidase [Anaerovoracaceae bacterium]
MKKKQLLGIILLVTIVLISLVCCGYTANTTPAAQGDKPLISGKSYFGTQKTLVMWSKLDDVSGYKIFRANEKNGDFKIIKTINSVNTRRFVDTGLKTGATYYYKVAGCSVDYDAISLSTPSTTIGIKVKGVIKSDPKDKLMIVNKNNKMSSKYVPTNLRSLTGYSTSDVKVKSYVKTAYIKLYNAAKEDGHTIKAVSGYRSYALQKYLFNYYVSVDGLKEAERASARPGTSEHQTGLAIDVSSASVGYDLLERYGNEKEGKWLKNNAYKYGFIIRYEQGKEKRTGYMYEPWHIRFVGKEAAKYITENDLTLEQYLKY